MQLEVCVQIRDVLILSLDHNTSWHKHAMGKHVLSDQTSFLSGQNLSLARQMTCLLTKIICRLGMGATCCGGCGEAGVGRGGGG